jgi:uncharacterized RDD family membrane protein YckC
MLSNDGYLSEESKRRFTLVAGVLGAVFFLAQTVLPMLLMFAIMMPTMLSQELVTLDVDRAALWRDELWLVQRTRKINWRVPESSATTVSLVRMRLTDLTTVGPAIPLEIGEDDPFAALLPIGDRLWVIGEKVVAYYAGASLTRVNVQTRPPRASAPFAYGGRPAVISLGAVPALATLQAEGPQAGWISRELPLGLPPEAGEKGPMFPLVFFGMFIGAFVFSVAVLLAYSYFEGRSGKTPGKWVLRIRVLGTDLQPCGFRRAFVRNLLTFVDGFFSFLVGALLVALTEKWQRLGDLAARTVVVADARPAGQV